LIAEVQAEFNDLLIQLGGEDPADPGHPDHDATGGLLDAWVQVNGIDITTNDDPTNQNVRAYKAARHNYFFVLADASFGIHNYKYMKQLLLDSIASLTL
jgi:hypothetical protein